MTDRYERTRQAIACRLFGNEDPGDIVKTADTGDKHLHGDAVTRIETSGGKTVYYKPRDCRSNDLLGDITEALFGIRLVPEQVSGDGFAFQKEVPVKIPSTDDEKAAYYINLGRLASVFYAIGSTDMHKDNVIASGIYPITIDTETLLCARADGVGGTGEFSVDYGEIFPDYLMSVGESMILPRFFGFMQTTPLIPGKDCRPEGYEEQFIDGFTEGYNRIRDNRDQIGAILDKYSDIPLRYLLRSTQSYAMKIHMYYRTEDEAERARVLKKLEKGLSPEDIIRWAPVLNWERECIIEKDIPYFWFCAGGRDLMGDVTAEPLIKEYLKRSPIEYAKWRMDRMGDSDLQVQIAYIRASLLHIDGWGTDHKAGSPGTDIPDTPLSKEEAVSEVCDAIEKLRNERIPLSDGHCLWHTPLINGKVGCLYGVGEGFSGVAVFVKACADSPLITGKYHDMAKEMSAACYSDMASFAEYLIRTYPEGVEERVINRRFNSGFGFADGLKGLMWALGKYRDEYTDRTDMIIDSLGRWDIGYDPGEADKEFTACFGDSDMTDNIENGISGRAAALLSGSGEDILQAGRILRKIYTAKKDTGYYRIYPMTRKKYFLPAFLRGNTGIAYVMLQYAQSLMT